MQFVTAWFGRWHADTGIIDTIAAGHGPMLLIRHDGTVTVLEADVPPLGVIDTLMASETVPIHMEPGDLLAVPTDGIIEAMLDDGTMYGQDRLVDLLSKGRSRPLPELLQTLREDCEGFRPGQPAQDDRTILAIHRKA